MVSRASGLKDEEENMLARSGNSRGRLLAEIGGKDGNHFAVSLVQEDTDAPSAIPVGSVSQRTYAAGVTFSATSFSATLGWLEPEKPVRRVASGKPRPIADTDPAGAFLLRFFFRCTPCVP